MTSVNVTLHEDQPIFMIISPWILLITLKFQAKLWTN